MIAMLTKKYFILSLVFNFLVVSLFCPNVYALDLLSPLSMTKEQALELLEKTNQLNILSKKPITGPSYLLGRLVAGLLLIPATFGMAIVLLVYPFMNIKGSPILIQERVGYKGKPINIVKFRTLIDLDSGVKRMNKFGKWVRLLRLDELPQLFDIFTGKMVWFGPRALVPYEVSNVYRDLLNYTPPGVFSAYYLHEKILLATETGIKKDVLLRTYWGIYDLENWSLSYAWKFLIKLSFKVFKEMIPGMAKIPAESVLIHRNERGIVTEEKFRQSA